MSAAHRRQTATALGLPQRQGVHSLAAASKSLCIARPHGLPQITLFDSLPGCPPAKRTARCFEEAEQSPSTGRIQHLNKLGNGAPYCRFELPSGQPVTVARPLQGNDTATGDL